MEREAEREEEEAGENEVAHEGVAVESPRRGVAGEAGGEGLDEAGEAFCVGGFSEPGGGICCCVKEERTEDGGGQEHSGTSTATELPAEGGEGRGAHVDFSK